MLCLLLVYVIGEFIFENGGTGGNFEHGHVGVGYDGGLFAPPPPTSHKYTNHIVYVLFTCYLHVFLHSLYCIVLNLKCFTVFTLEKKKIGKTQNSKVVEFEN